MKKLIVLTTFLLSAQLLLAEVTEYEVSFSNGKSAILRSSADQTVAIELTAGKDYNKNDQANYKLTIEVDVKQTSLAPKDYEIVQGLTDVKLADLKAKGNLVVIKILREDSNDIQNKQVKLILKIVIKNTNGEIQTNNKGTTLTHQIDIYPFAPSGANAAANLSAGEKTVHDSSNYVKTDLVQYTDFAGFDNDKPNGILQFQGLLKLPLNMKKTQYHNGSSSQWLRSVIFDVLLNRIDKSKEEVDYRYTNNYYISDGALKKATQPWLATTDLWRYSNFQLGLRLTLFGVEQNNFRAQLQAGVRLLKNRPISEDTIRSGIDSGKVRSDFRSVYSNAKFIEIFMKTLKVNERFDINGSIGIMWLKLMDSYYQQVEINQQDPFQRNVAISSLSQLARNHPLWYFTFRIGYLMGQDEAIGTFLRFNYVRQSGTYFPPSTSTSNGPLIAGEERRFHNNFFQIHFGTTFLLEKIFSPKESKEKKNDGLVNNSF